MSQGEKNEALLSMLAGIGIGALVGTVAALLLAPQAGEETRTQLRDTADDLLVRLRDNVEDLRTKVDEMVASVRSRSADEDADTDGAAALPPAAATDDGDDEGEQVGMMPGNEVAVA